METHPLTPDRWADFEQLFGANGACAGCWCMWWRLTAAEFTRGAGAANRAAMKALVDSGGVPGLLAYDDAGEPVGWVSVAPRAEFGRLERSPKLKRVDERPVWSVVCFFVKAGRRRTGLGRRLLDAAVDWVRAQGGDLVEGYPVDTSRRAMSSTELFTGDESLFAAAGFDEAVRRGGRAIVRRVP